MEPKRSLMVSVLVVVVAIWAGMLLGGCASTGDPKDAGLGIQSPPPVDEATTAHTDTSGSQPEAQRSAGIPEAPKQPVVKTGSSAEAPHVEEANPGTDETRFGQLAANLGPALQRILPEALRGMNWNRIVTVLGGLVAMALVWGLALWLARLPRRRYGAGRAAGGRQVAGHSRVPVTQ